MRVLWLCVILLLNASVGFSQCPVSNFSIQANACLDEQLLLRNESTNAVAYEWAFCDTDLTATPTKEKIIAGFGAVYNSKFVKDNAGLFLLFVSQTQNRLVVLRMDDISRWQYTLHAQIDISGLITNAAGIDVINENGIWTALISSINSPFKLVKVTLSGDLKSITSQADLSSNLVLSTTFDVKIFHDGANYFTLVANSAGAVNRQLALLSFGSTLANTPGVSYVTLPASSAASSVDVYRTCDRWVAFVSSRNGKVFRVDLGASPGVTTPVLTELVLSSPVDDPGGLAVVEDHDELVLLLQSRNGSTYAGKISSLSDNTVDITNFGNIKSTSRDWGIETIQIDGAWKIVSANFASGNGSGFYVLEFFRICPVTARFVSAEQHEQIAFGQAGTFKISLKSINALGDLNIITKQVVVSGQPAPVITSTHPDVYCVNAPVSFSLSSDLALTDQQWDFGDGSGLSPEDAPEHSYATAGNHDVILRVTAQNGCTNLAPSMITIYDKPQAGFLIPSGLLCTNGELVFAATTTDSYQGHLRYEWQIDNVPVSETRDLTHTFLETGEKSITLQTAIPGCSDAITKTTSQFEAGPVIDFHYAGTCEDETFLFQGEGSEPISDYSWNFSNGHTAKGESPSHVFSEYGNYSVTLKTTSTIGCRNTKVKNVVVRSRPVIEFSAAGPPNACEDVITTFENHTTNPDGDEIVGWEWDFGDATPGQSDQFGKHKYEEAGDYVVSLKATTIAGCLETHENIVTIFSAPPTGYRHTAVCEDQPVDFGLESGSEIAEAYWEIGTSYYTEDSPRHTFAAPGTYALYLEVRGMNGCVLSRTDAVKVPVPLNPDFSIVKNCVGQDAIVTDLTSGADAVASRSWIFNGTDTRSGAQVSHAFQETGSATVRLTVTGVSGCSYSTIRTVNIVEPPRAGFTADPSSGAFPLDVRFTNTSVGATNYQWSFDDGSGQTSEAFSPTHIFPGPGSYQVQLKATNKEGCEDSFSDAITTVSPAADARIELINLATNPDGTTKLIVTILNKGNTILKELPLAMDFDGTIHLREVLAQPIAPGSRVNFIFNTSMVSLQNLQYLCITLDLGDDVVPADNRRCEQFSSGLIIFPGYPNPSPGTLNVEWIAHIASPVHISLSDTRGQLVFSSAYAGTEGFNAQTLDLSGIRGGLYFLVISDGQTRTIQRIVVSKAP